MPLLDKHPLLSRLERLTFGFTFGFARKDAFRADSWSSGPRLSYCNFYCILYTCHVLIPGTAFTRTAGDERDGKDGQEGIKRQAHENIIAQATTNAEQQLQLRPRGKLMRESELLKAPWSPKRSK